jgi:hypothetical protein
MDPPLERAVAGESRFVAARSPRPAFSFPFRRRFFCSFGGLSPP